MFREVALAYQELFLRGGFLPSADGMVSIAAGSTVGGGSTVNWSNSLLTPNTVRACCANDFGLTDVYTPAFDEHLQAVFDRIKRNDKVATQNGPHERLRGGASELGYSYRVATLNIDPENYDPNLIGYSGMGDQTGAKQGTMRTYLQDASDAGAKLLPNVWVDRILTENGMATGVEATYTDPQTQETSRIVINAPSVAVAAGSLETPGLLLRSGIGGPAVGAELRLHPASLVSGIYDEPQDPWYGPAMAGIMNEFAEGDEDSATSSNASSTCPACSPPSSLGLTALSTKSSPANTGTEPTGCSSSRTVVPEPSPSTRTVNRPSGIRSPTNSIVVTSAKPQ